MPQPKSGRITRSPGAVARMMRIDSLMSCSYSLMAMRPFIGFTPTGNFQPRPRKALNIALSDQHRWGAHRNRVWCAGFHNLIALPRSRQAANHHRHTAHRHHASYMRLGPVGERTRVKIARASPRRHAANQHRRTTRPGAEWGSVALLIAG